MGRQSTSGLVLVLSGLFLRVSCFSDVSLTTADCSGDRLTFRDDSGKITTGHPAVYTENCYWRASVESYSGLPLWVTLKEVDIGIGDEFILYNDEGVSHRFTFGDERPTTDLQFGYYFKFNFNSDGLGNDRGFILSWSTVKSDIERTQLEYTLQGDVYEREVFRGVTLFLQSPNYPEKFPPNALVHWILTAPDGERIIFHFQDFKMDSRGDQLSFYSGPDLETEELIGQYEGNLVSDLPPPLLSPYNRVHVKFVSNNLLQEKGFSVQYTVYQPTITAPPSTTTQQTTKRTLGLVTMAVVVVLGILAFLAVIRFYLSL